jgi:hypothetical protein
MQKKNKKQKQETKTRNKNKKQKQVLLMTAECFHKRCFAIRFSLPFCLLSGVVLVEEIRQGRRI